MENENENVPMIEKQSLFADKPFKVLTKQPSTFWKTGYEYYLHLRSQNLPIRHLIGKYDDDNGKKVFKVYKDGQWIESNFWDYSEPVIDKMTGKTELNSAGKTKNRPYFKEKKKYLIEFDQPYEFEYWDKETKSVVKRPLTKIYMIMSTNLSEKIQDQISDPRNSDGSKYIIKYDKNKAPAEQYKVKYFSA